MWQSPYDIRYRSLRLLHEDSARIWDNPGPSFQASQGARTAGQHMYTIALSGESSRTETERKANRVNMGFGDDGVILKKASANHTKVQLCCYVI